MPREIDTAKDPRGRDMGTLNEIEREKDHDPHPWYGPCDAMLPDGGCYECDKSKGSHAEEELTSKHDKFGDTREGRSMKLTIDIQVHDVVVILKRPEGYEDVDADLLLDDAIAMDWPQVPVVVWPREE